MRWVDKKKRWRPRQRLPRHLLTSQAEPWNAKDPSIKKKRPADKWPSVSGIHNNSTHTKRTKKNKLWWKRRSTQTRRTCGPFFFCLFFSFFFWLSGNEENQWKVQWKSKKNQLNQRRKEFPFSHQQTAKTLACRDENQFGCTMMSLRLNGIGFTELSRADLLSYSSRTSLHSNGHSSNSFTESLPSKTR